MARNIEVVTVDVTEVVGVEEIVEVKVLDPGVAAVVDSVVDAELVAEVVAVVFTVLDSVED